MTHSAVYIVSRFLSVKPMKYNDSLSAFFDFIFPNIYESQAVANYPQELAQDAMCQSHTGHMTGLWFLPARPLWLNTNEWMNHTPSNHMNVMVIFPYPVHSQTKKRPQCLHQIFCYVCWCSGLLKICITCCVEGPQFCSHTVLSRLLH